MCVPQRGRSVGLCSISLIRDPPRKRFLGAEHSLKLGHFERSLEDVFKSRTKRSAISQYGAEESLTGTWKKNKELSDSMDKAFASVKLPWIYRKAVNFLNYLQIENDEVYFKTILKAGGIMDVVEEYPWTGEMVVHNRRDKRQGTHTGKVVMTEQGPQLQLQWDEPYSGKGTDTFILSNGGTRLTQLSSSEFKDESKNCTYRTVYTRWQGDRK